MTSNPNLKPRPSAIWADSTLKVKGLNRLTRKFSKGGSADAVDIDDDYSPDFSERASAVQLISHANSAKSVAEEDEFLNSEIPSEFAVLPVYREILDEPLPAMEIFPPFQVEEGEVDIVIGKMDERLRRNHSYKAFLEETRNLLTYVLQEVKLRKAMQSQLMHREGEMKNIIEHHKRDRRVHKVLMLADHWRNDKEQSEEKIHTLTMEINALTMDLKVMENKLASMLKRQEKMEGQIQKNRGCEQEKDRLEEQIMQKEKAILDMAENVDQLKSTVTQMTAEAAHKEHEFKVKLEAAPDRNAIKLAALSRELDIMSLEKEYKMQEARELHTHVNALIVKNSRTSDRVKLLMGSVRALKQQVRALEFKHQVVVVKNKGLNRQLNASVALVKGKEMDRVDVVKENAILKKKLQELQTLLKEEKNRYSSVIRSVGVLETKNNAIRKDLTETKLMNRNLEKGMIEATINAQQNETNANNATRMHLKDAQRAKELQRKVTTSTRHVRMVLHNITLMSEEIDRNGKKLRLLDSELTRCQDENVRNSSTITHLYRLLENTEDMVRLQTRENDALIINKGRLVDSLKICCNAKKTLHNEISTLKTAKTGLEDAAITFKFMLDFVESERDGALRNVKHYVDNIVILQRKQVARIAEIARANGESSKLRLQLEDMQKQLNVQKREVYNLNKSLKAAEANYKEMESTCRTLMIQRDLFGSRVLQQNNEADLSRIKMEDMSRTLDQGHTLYRDRCNDISVLKKEIQNLRRRIKALEHTESLCHDLRTEVACLTKNISLEMNKRVAIESCKMTNVHRHRELQSNDPSVYELVTKIQTLQKLVIRKTQDCIVKEKEIAIRNDTIQTLEKAIRRRDKVIHHKSDKTLARSVVERKDQQIKGLLAELGMLQSYLDSKSKLTEEQRKELSTVRREITQLKRSKSASVSSPSSHLSSLDSVTGSTTESNVRSGGPVFRPGWSSFTSDENKSEGTVGLFKPGGSFGSSDDGRPFKQKVTPRDPPAPGGAAS